MRKYGAMKLKIKCFKHFKYDVEKNKLYENNN